MSEENNEEKPIWIQWKNEGELSDSDKTRLESIKGSWTCFKDEPDRKFFIKEMDGKLIICNEWKIILLGGNT